MSDSLPSGGLSDAVSNVLSSSSSAVAEVMAKVNSTVSNLTQQQDGKTSTSEDEITYPGLEKLLLPQQEL